MKTYVPEWMMAKGLTKEELAKKVGVSPKVIQKWIDEESTPSVTQLSIISKELQVSLDDLVNRDPNLAKNENPNTWIMDMGARLLINFNLQQWLDEKNITVKDIHDNLGVPETIVQNWLDFKANPTLMQAAALAQYLGITMDMMLNAKAPKDAPEYHPEDDIGGHHFFETTSHTEAVRFQHWCDKYQIASEIAAIEIKKKATYVVNYENPFPFTALKIFGIVSNPLNMDIRERLTGKKKFDRMEVLFNRRTPDGTPVAAPVVTNEEAATETKPSSTNIDDHVASPVVNPETGEVEPGPEDYIPDDAINAMLDED